MELGGLDQVMVAQLYARRAALGSILKRLLPTVFERRRLIVAVIHEREIVLLAKQQQVHPPCSSTPCALLLQG